MHYNHHFILEAPGYVVGQMPMVHTLNVMG
jgi:hypothetical protein